MCTQKCWYAVLQFRYPWRGRRYRRKLDVWSIPRTGMLGILSFLDLCVMLLIIIFIIFEAFCFNLIIMNKFPLYCRHLRICTAKSVGLKMPFQSHCWNSGVISIYAKNIVIREWNRNVPLLIWKLMLITAKEPLLVLMQRQHIVYSWEKSFSIYYLYM